MLDIPADWVRALNTSKMGDLLGDQLSGPEARGLMGTCVITFSELERADVEIYETPGVLEYIMALHESLPHLFYFLSPIPVGGAVQFFLLGEHKRRGIPLPDELVPSIVTALRNRLINAAQYATTKGDDWQPIVFNLVGSVPALASFDLYRQISAELESPHFDVDSS